MSQEGKTKLWGGRFTGKTDPIMEKFNASIGFDKRLAVEDIQGSEAYAKGLLGVKIITQDEYDELIKGLKIVKQEWIDGKFVIDPVTDEDIHTANERRLSEILKPENENEVNVAGKLHTGRSRNDQCVTDLRLWLREQIKELLKLMKSLISVSVARASKEIQYLMPGYTHLQRAQPIRWSHWILSYTWQFQRDTDRLKEIYHRVNMSPLGSGALAGNPFKVDRELLGRELEFDGLCMNSIDAVSDRDFVIEFLFWSTLCMVHMSRFSEDLIIYSSREFSFIDLADAYSTGSSLMPQKKNPDSLELLRGKSARVFGQLNTLLMAVKGLPSTYNKDLQEDKEALFDGVDTMFDSIQIATGVISTLTVNHEKMKEALSTEMLATDLAEFLVRNRNIPFRETHHIVGSVVKIAEDKYNGDISKLNDEELKSVHKDAFHDEEILKKVKKVWDFEQSVEERSSIGGTSKSAVQHQIDELTKWLNKD